MFHLFLYFTCLLSCSIDLLIFSVNYYIHYINTKELFSEKIGNFSLIHTQNVEIILRMQSRRESNDFQLQDLIKISGFPILFA